MGKFFIFSNKNISWNLFFFFVLSSVLSRPCFPLFRHCRCRIPVGIDIQTGWLTKYPFTHNFSLYPSIGYCLELVTPSSLFFFKNLEKVQPAPFLGEGFRTMYYCEFCICTLRFLLFLCWEKLCQLRQGLWLRNIHRHRTGLWNGVFLNLPFGTAIGICGTTCCNFWSMWS